MNPLALVLSVIILAICFFAIFWIGIYVVLPIALFFMLVSIVVSLLNKFNLSPKHDRYNTKHTKTAKAQIIDVEYEEIK